MFMLLTGRLEKCWQLTASVSRVCVALGGRYLASLAAASSADESLEVRYSLALCYMFDKALSMSMNRPSFLPDMNLNASMLVPSDASRPCTALVHIFLELSQVQDYIVRDMRPRKDQKDLLNKVQILQHKMWKIRDKMRQVRILSFGTICSTSAYKN